MSLVSSSQCACVRQKMEISPSCVGYVGWGDAVMAFAMRSHDDPSSTMARFRVIAGMQTSCHRHLDALSAPGLPAGEKRGQDACRQMDSHSHVDERCGGSHSRRSGYPVTLTIPHAAGPL